MSENADITRKLRPSRWRFSPEEWMAKFGLWFVPEPNTGCWLWIRSLDDKGYGQVRLRNTMRKAHRVAYETMRGPVPQGLQLDHLCRQRSCVNPGHLEAVTQAENILRGTSPTVANGLKTHCKNGHEFTPENIYRKASHPSQRWCRKCTLDYQREAYQREIGQRAQA